jgi:hypothetical protein
MTPSLSCVTFEEARGEHDLTSLDVPDQDYVSGCSTGVLVFLEAVKASRDDGEPWFETIARAAMVHKEKNDGPFGKGKRGAAVGFLSTMGEALVAFSAGVTLESFVDGLISTERECAEHRIKEASLAEEHQIKILESTADNLLKRESAHA